MLNQILYGWGDGKSGVAVYAIDGSRCIFSGINWPATSTINAAEEIVQQIAQTAGLDSLEMTFFDLRTSWGYPDLKIGGHQFLRLHLERTDGETAVSQWEPVSPSEDDLRPFMMYITSAKDEN